MRRAEWINLFFFSLFIALAWRHPSTKRQRKDVTTIGAIGISLILAVQVLSDALALFSTSVLRDWLPAPLMLMVYWQAGRFFRQPNEQLQTKLEELDQKLLGAILSNRTTSRKHGWVASYLEIAYLFCYALVPLGIAVLYFMHLGHYADRYWTTVLPPTYLCYAFLPFVQTLPPRMLARDRDFSALPSKTRKLNLWILRYLSIQVNTFPSAHVASTMAASLALLRLVPLAGAIFLWVSISIAAGAVMGRYHYTADAFTAAALAVAVFLVEALFLH